MKKGMAWKYVLVASVATLVVSGCSGGGKSATTGGDSTKTKADDLPQVSKEPVELTVYYPFSDLQSDAFMKDYWSLVQLKYPNFNVKLINSGMLSMADLAATKTPVDIFFSNANSAAQFADLGYVTDVSELAKKHKFDLTRVEPVALDIIKKASNGQLSALPIYTNYHLMFYNKDIFDKFGVSYPKNGMTWDETYDLAKKMTRQDNGVNYIGFSNQFLNGTMLLLNSYGQEILDVKTKKVTFDNGKWPDIMNNYLRFFQIQGHEYLVGEPSLKAFAKEQRLAMQVTLSNRVVGNPDQVPSNWDIVSHPVYADKRGIGSGLEPLYYYLSSTSKHKDEAFLAITAMLSNEVQTKQAQKGLYPAVNMSNLKEVYAQVPTLKGKNIDAMFVNKPAPAITLTQDVIVVRNSLTKALDAIMKGQKDINTALREATEEGNKTMAERIASGQSK